MSFTPSHPIQNISHPPAGVKTNATKPGRCGLLKEGCGPGPEAGKVQVCPRHVSPRHIWTQWLAFTDDRDLVTLASRETILLNTQAARVPSPHPTRPAIGRHFLIAFQMTADKFGEGECCEQQEGDSYLFETTRFPDRAQNYPFPSQYGGGLLVTDPVCSSL